MPFCKMKKSTDKAYFFYHRPMNLHRHHMPHNCEKMASTTSKI